MTRKTRPPRERRIRPEPETMDAGINESTEPEVQRVADPLFKPPFTAEGAQVYDKSGRAVCLCGASGGVPWDTRLRMAEELAARMNGTPAEAGPQTPPQRKLTDGGPDDAYGDNNGALA